MDGWDAVTAALFVVGIGCATYALIYWMRRAILGRNQAPPESPQTTAQSTVPPHDPPPLRTRPPPGCAVVEHPGSHVTLAYVV